MSASPASWAPTAPRSARPGVGAQDATTSASVPTVSRADPTPVPASSTARLASGDQVAIRVSGLLFIYLFVLIGYLLSDDKGKVDLRGCCGVGVFFLYYP